MANDTNDASKIKIRRDTTANWNSLNPVLDDGEIGIEWIDKTNGICKIKIGNDSKHWLELPYFASSYSDITKNLPKINGITVKGNLSLQTLGIQPSGNYALSSEIDALVDKDEEFEEAIETLNDKVDEYVDKSVPSIDGNEGKYLKVIDDNNELKMVWSDITGDIVTENELKAILTGDPSGQSSISSDGYVEKEENKGLSTNDFTDELKASLENVGNYDLEGMVNDITSIEDELNTSVVHKTDLRTYISDEDLDKILTGDSSGETHYSENGYVSKDEFTEKADASVVTNHILSVYDEQAKSSVNPHGITKETIGLGNVDNTSDVNKPISNAAQEALDLKQDKLYTKPSKGIDIVWEPDENDVYHWYLENTDKGSKTKWTDLRGSPTDISAKLDFQADWDEEDIESLHYIKNKPELQHYVLPIASSETLGGIKIGDKFAVDSEGTLDLTLEVNDYENLENKPSMLVPMRYDLHLKGTVPNTAGLPAVGDAKGDYYEVYDGGDIRLYYVWDGTNWRQLSDIDKQMGYIVVPGETYEYPLIKGMIPADLNLASLTVAKSMDDILDAKKADKTVVEELARRVDEIAPDTDRMVTKDELYSNYYNKTDTNNLLDTKADVGLVETLSNSLTALTSHVNNTDATVSQLSDEAERKNNKKDTMNGLTEDQMKVYYPSIKGAKDYADEIDTRLQNDYNNKIHLEELRATDAEETIANDLHTNYYTKTEVDTKVSSVYRYKGTVNYYSDLPTSNNEEGDVWNVVNADVSHNVKAGDNVAWVASKPGVTEHWDVLAGITDLSNYYNKQQADDKFATKGEYNEDIGDLEDLINGINDTLTAELATKAPKANSLAGYGITDAYTKVDVNNLVNNAVAPKGEQTELDAVTAPMVYRGTVELYSELPTTGLNVNDLYVVSSTRQYYAWDGTQWVRQTPISEKADAVSVYTKTEADNNFATISTVNNKANTTDLNTHINNHNNPHQVTKAQIGLGNVDNTSDANKPVSTATQLALNNKQNNLTPVQLNAVNSGITAERVTSYDTAVTTIPTLATNTALAEVRQTANTAAATAATKADASNVYTKAEVDGKLTAGMHYKGTKATVDDLPVSGNVVGDMWNVLSNGANYAWNGSSWDKLSETVDLSVYYTKTEIDTKTTTIDNSISNLQTQINGKQATLIAGANVTIENNVISADVDGTLATKLSELTNDVGFITLSQVPAINNATLTIQKNGVDVDTFTANASVDKSINITVPTKVTDLSDASNYVKSTALATVATTNEYSDLYNTPTIGNGVLTIQRNGLTVDTFSANATSAKTINITVPTTVAELSDASNYELPSQTGQSGKFLTTNGTDASWATVDALPSQLGNNGKFLTTNGSTASWKTVTIPTVDQTYDATSANAQSGVAIQTKLSSDYYTKSEIDTMIGNIETILQQLNSGNN